MTEPVSRGFVLTNIRGQHLTKVHSTREAVATEAFEKGFVYQAKGVKAFPPGFEIVEVKNSSTYVPRYP